MGSGSSTIKPEFVNVETQTCCDNDKSSRVTVPDTETSVKLTVKTDESIVNTNGNLPIEESIITAKPICNNRRNSIDMFVVARTEVIAKRKVVRHGALRASVIMTTKLVTDTLSAFKSYTIEEPTPEDLEYAQEQRQVLLQPGEYVEFYEAVHEYFRNVSNGILSFTTKSSAYQNKFLLELLELLLFQGSRRISFAEQVSEFGKNHKSEGILVAEYGYIAEAIIYAINHALKIPAEESLWPKLFSRFARTLVPSMIITNTTSALLESPLTSSKRTSTNTGFNLFSPQGLKNFANRSFSLSKKYEVLTGP